MSGARGRSGLIQEAGGSGYVECVVTESLRGTVMFGNRKMLLATVGLAAAAIATSAAPAAADFVLGAEELVQAGGSAVAVPGYSVPSFALWNGDALPDLIVGEGGSGFAGKVRVYLNQGTWYQPAFGDFFYAQTSLGELEVPSEGLAFQLHPAIECTGVCRFHERISFSRQKRGG